MATDAKEWLSGPRDYNAGLQLLKESGRTGWLIDMLETGPEHYNTLKLTTEIEKLAAAWNAIPVAPLDTAESKLIARISDGMEKLPLMDDRLTPGERFEDTKILLHKKAAVKQLFTELVFLRAKAAQLPAGPELYACAREILLKDFKRRDLWDEINFFETEGKWFEPVRQPKDSAVDVNDKASREQKIKNLMANRSKVSARLDKPLAAGKTKFYQEKFDKLTAEIDELKKYRA